MGATTPTHLDGRRRLATQCCFVVLTVLIASVVLWLRQTSDALLRVDNFGAAIAEVVFWAIPTFLLYMLLTRRPRVVIAGGVILVIVWAWGWWSFAVDRHSTASIGPGALGWFIGPLVIVMMWLLARTSRRS